MPTVMPSSMRILRELIKVLRIVLKKAKLRLVGYKGRRTGSS